MRTRAMLAAALWTVALAAYGWAVWAAQAPPGPARIRMGPWHQIGPFVPASGRGFATEFGPERAGDFAAPCGGQRWERRDYEDGVPHSFEVPANGSVYLARTISAPSAQVLRVYLGSDDGLTVWLNGRNLLSRDVPRVVEPDQDVLDLRLDRGDNRLLLKVYNGAGGCGFYFSTAPTAAKPEDADPVSRAAGFSVPALRRAIEDLRTTYGPEYPRGSEFSARLDRLVASLAADQAPARLAELRALQREALLANPLLRFRDMLVVKRREDRLGLPQNWQGNSSIPAYGYDNEIAVLSAGTGAMRTLYRPSEGACVGDLELRYDATRFLFSMPGTQRRFQLFEMRVDGTGLRQVTPGDQPDVDNYSGTYLPDGRIIFCSTACYTGVPCVGGSDSVGALYLLDERSRSIRQLTFDQDHSWYPRVLNDGEVVYTRWEYSDTPHYFSRLLFRMNPDGTSQFALYGSNSYWPNGIFYARPVPGDPSRIVGIVSGHHGVPRMGELVLFDPDRGRHEAEGAVQRIPGYGLPVKPVIRDQLVEISSPRFLHPYPLSGKYFLVSCKPDGHPWGIYLVDVFDNMLCLAETPGYALLEPVPLQTRPVPPAIPDRTRPGETTATVLLADVYSGPGLRGVPRGAVKRLRIVANHYAYRGMGGHFNVGVDGPWDVKRILGTVPVEPDGSAHFTVPANLPIAVQPLDAAGKALQVMRSWYTAMPGERASCTGCHEPQATSPGRSRPLAARRQPSGITPWYGPARGFSFEREVQARVLQPYCVPCHNGTPGPGGRSLPDFRARSERRDYGGAFTPAYEALHRYVRRPGNESDYRLSIAAEWDANTSELVQMLRKGHHGVRLPRAGWDRLYTWIDLNVPCHGTWTEQNGSTPRLNARLLELARLYGGSEIDHERYPEPVPTEAAPPGQPRVQARPQSAPAAPGWPFSVDAARSRQRAQGAATQTVDLGGGVRLTLARIPAGEFLMGSQDGADDERPVSPVRIGRSFWMATLETTNEQYARFDPSHDNGVISMHNKDHDTRGYPMDRAAQPVVRVSWNDARRFCDWLSLRTGRRFRLPTEAEWEWACRAGSAQPFWYGNRDADFSAYGNLGDRTLRDLSVQGLPPRPVTNPNPVLDWVPKDERFADGSLITADTGSYAPNPWGLYDMHGNAAEWTLSSYRAYPYAEADGRNTVTAQGEKVVRGGSWFDRPYRCTSSYRLAYPAWQAVYNVGLRVVCEEPAPRRSHRANQPAARRTGHRAVRRGASGERYRQPPVGSRRRRHRQSWPVAAAAAMVTDSGDHRLVVAQPRTRGREVALRTRGVPAPQGRDDDGQRRVSP